MSIKNSAIYRGRVRHRRLSPTYHNFTYNIFMMYLDLDEIDEVLALSALWSKNKLALAQFRRSDYFGDNTEQLKSSVTKKVFEELGIELNGRICILTNLRYFGYIINPITIYYCFDEQHKLRALLLEVTNTPWGEKQQYALECEPENGICEQEFQKSMHVSPFHPMNMTYHWQSNMLNQQINVHMKNIIDEACIFDAELNLEKSDVTAKSLNRVILTYPFMTIKIAASIYWQALRLWLKKVPFYTNPKKMNT